MATLKISTANVRRNDELFKIPMSLFLDKGFLIAKATM